MEIPNIESILEKLITVLPFIITSFIIVVILTPLISKFARLVKAIDIPKFKKRRVKLMGKKLKDRNGIPRLGGLGILIAILVLMFYVEGLTLFTVSLGAGIIILTVVGGLDDIYDLKGGIQLIFQIIAVVCVVIGGTRITNIDLFGLKMNFDYFSYSIPFLEANIQFVFPADIITIFWFLVIINAMNWVAGIDALEETMSIVASVMLMLLSIRFGKESMLVHTAIFTGAVLGFWIFNFPPAFIISGTIGNTLLGFLLATYAIRIDGKMTTSILLLAVPLIDFVWVLVGRLIKYKEYNPWKLMNISGDHHLHHRLLKLGFSGKQVLFIEVTIFSVFALAAYYFAGFNIVAIVILAGIVTLLIFFAVITFLRVKKVKVTETKEVVEGKVKTAKVKKSPESEYAY